MAHSVLIVGLGRIGMGYDLEHSSKQFILTHARAFREHAQFRLAGGVDPEAERRRLFEAHYGCKAFDNLQEAIRVTCPAVVVVSTPTEKHYSTVIEVLRYCAPIAILCEKPISFDVAQAHEIVAKCKENNCALYVNYMRRSDVGVEELLMRLNDGRIKHPVKGVVWYSKGLFNSASHFLNLLQYLLGQVENVQVLDVGRLGDCSDPESDFVVTFSRGKVHFFALRAENFFHNSMELMTSNGRLRYERGGEHIFWEGTASNKVYSEYTTLDIQSESLPSDFYRVQWHVTDQLAVELAGGKARICSGDDALSTLKILAKIKECHE